MGMRAVRSCNRLDCYKMTVYVDDMYKYPIGQFRRMKMSHMIADTEAELHAMADKIGLARKWYQGDHYDVSMTLRAKAVTAGAQEITMYELAVKCRPKLKMFIMDEASSFDWSQFI